MIVVVWGCKVCWLGCKKCGLVDYIRSMRAVRSCLERGAHGVPAYPARCFKYDRIEDKSEDVTVNSVGMNHACPRSEVLRSEATQRGSNASIYTFRASILTEGYHIQIVCLKAASSTLLGRGGPSVIEMRRP